MIIFPSTHHNIKLTRNTEQDWDEDKARFEQSASDFPEDAAEWGRDLVDLDTLYPRLKRELPRHPQPEVVLTAMNRNLQIRLDILDRQLELHGADQTALASESRAEYTLADSRQVAGSVLRHDR